MRRVIALVGLLLGGAEVHAFAQAPFVDTPRATVRAAARTQAALLLDLLAKDLPPAVRDAGQTRLRGEWLPLFVHSLHRGDSQESDRTVAAIERCLSSEGADVRACGRAAERLRESERDTSAVDARRDATRRAAVLSVLLVSDSGIGERYEEALEVLGHGGDDDAGDRGDDESAPGPADWQLARASLAEIRRGIEAVDADSAGPATREAIDREVVGLEALLGSSLPPEPMSGSPEAAEAYAEALLAALETALDADLYPGRDLAQTIATVETLVSGSCTATSAGVAREDAAIARWFYRNGLASPLGLLSPDAAATLAERLDARIAEPGARERDCPVLRRALGALSAFRSAP